MIRHIISAVPLAVGHPFDLISQIITKTFSVAVPVHLRAWDVITDLCEILMQEWRSHPLHYCSYSMVSVSSAPVTTAAQGSSFLLPCSVQTPKRGSEALSQWGSICVQWHSVGIFPRALQRVVQLHTIFRKAFPFLNFPRHFFIGHENHRLMIELWKNIQV